jgi:hypothetical protein
MIWNSSNESEDLGDVITYGGRCLLEDKAEKRNEVFHTELGSQNVDGSKLNGEVASRQA